MFRSIHLFSVATGLILVASYLLLWPELVAADQGVNEDIAHCAAMDEAIVRLACYDKLAGSLELNRKPIPAPASSRPREPTPPEDLGAESLGRNEKPVDDDGLVQAKVINCVKDARKDYNFHLEGGQIWKQVSDRKLYFKECKFNVTISKDYFGYKMQIEGEPRRIRVKRIR